jgi:hypothetical protein
VKSREAKLIELDRLMASLRDQNATLEVEVGGQSYLRKLTQL